MKRTILVSASFVLAASAFAAGCGSKQDPPAQQPQGLYGQPGAPVDPNAAYGQPQPAQPYGAPQPGVAQPVPGQVPAAPQPAAATPPPAAAPSGADAATAAMVSAALHPRAANEARGMKEDGPAIGGMLQEGGTLTQEFMLLPGKCYTILAQGLPPIAELDMQLAAKPLLPNLPLAVLAADSTTGPSSSIAPGAKCYKNPFFVAAPVILTVKATRGSGPAGAQVYSK
jgi:hypothetical protein